MDTTKKRHMIVSAVILAFALLAIVKISDKLAAEEAGSVFAAENRNAAFYSYTTAASGGAITATPTSPGGVTATVSPTTTPTPSSRPTATPTATATPTPTPSVTPTPTPEVQDEPSPDAKVISIAAYYDGDTVLVGEDFDLEKVLVYSYYDDGFSQKITNFTVTDKTVKKAGSNMFVAMALGFTDTFYVTGKSVSSITAECSRYLFTVGNAPDERDITVNATFSDGSKETVKKGYTITPEVLNETGSQEVTITYHECEAKFTVFVKEQAEIKTLSVFYDGGDIYANTELDRNKITVNAVYADNSTERITTYKLVTEMFAASGAQKLKVSYMKKEASVDVTVKDLELTALRAKYIGEEVFIGTEYDPRYLYVYATYNNGQELRVETYEVYNKRIKYIGDNIIKIYLGDLSTTVIIPGCEVGAPDFTYASTVEVSSNGFDITIDTAIPKTLDPDVTEAKKISKPKLKHLYRILKTKTETYLGFKYGFVDNNNEAFLPMNVRITLPNTFDPAYTELYYSPNNKTILGCMNKMAVDDHTLEITIFKTGTYMLVYDPDKYVEEELPPEDEDE